jgi:hypothetical protein
VAQLKSASRALLWVWIGVSAAARRTVAGKVDLAEREFSLRMTPKTDKGKGRSRFLGFASE